MSWGRKRVYESVRLADSVAKERSLEIDTPLKKYATRFSEYFNEPAVYYVIDEFARLVDSGIKPDDAFSLIVEKAYG